MRAAFRCARSLVGSTGRVSSWVVALAAVAAACTSTTAPVSTPFAQVHDEPIPPSATDEVHAGEAHHEHGRGTQAVNVFIGGVDEIGRDEGFAIGIDYEYRLSPKWGVGGFAEAVTGAERSFVAGLQGYWHAVADLVLVAGPGVERRDGEAEGVFRIGAFYEFPLQTGFVLSPGIFYDFVEGDDVVVYGINIGKIW